MTGLDDIRCEKHVGEVFAPRCGDCDLERIVATSPIPDVVDIATDDELAEASVAMARDWIFTHDPAKAAAAITELATTTSQGRAVRVAHMAMHAYIERLTFHSTRLDQVVGLRIVPAVMSTLRQLAPGHLTAPDDIARPSRRGSGPTLGSDQ